MIDQMYDGKLQYHIIVFPSALILTTIGAKIIHYKAEMGCSASKLDDEEAVQLCKDRKNFIKQAIEYRKRFSYGHLVYIQSMKGVALALLHYVVADDLHELLSDSYTTPPFTPLKVLSPEIRDIPLKLCTPTSNETVKRTSRTVNFLRPGGNQSLTVEERPEPHETAHIESYYPMENYGISGFFASQSSPVNTSSYFSSPYNISSYQSSSPQASKWDSFWNPFSLDSYDYPPMSSYDRIVNDDDTARLREVREAEGIPELEEDIDDDDDDDDDGSSGGGGDGDDDDDHHHHHRFHNRREEMHWKTEANSKVTPEAEFMPTRVQVGDKSSVAASADIQKVHEVKEFKFKGTKSNEASRDQNTAQLEVPNQHQVAGTSNPDETPGFTVYMNRRPGSMAEVMKDMENQFTRICDCAHEMSVMLEVSNVPCSSASSELAVRMLKPTTFFRSASSHSTSSKFIQAASSSKGDADESSSDYSEECCMVSGSHRSTLDRLYAWEKKLYEEVKSGERVRIAYKKKCMQLRSHDINGEEPSVVDKTRATIRDLHTRLNISIHTVESISKRIEVLRDGELYPQLLEMIRGLCRMWKTMADCHLIQKRIIDEAKLLLFSNSAATIALSTPRRPPRAAANLAVEHRDALEGATVDAAAAAAEMAMVMGPKVLCAGLSVAVGSLAELAVVSADGYEEVVSRYGGGAAATANA